MPQQVCPWCSKAGERYASDRMYWALTPEERSQYDPHFDNADCICRHVTCGSQREAIRVGGRWWTGRKYRCEGCAFQRKFILSDDGKVFGKSTKLK